MDRFLRRELGPGTFHSELLTFEPTALVTQHGKKKSVRWFVLLTTHILILDNPPRKIISRIPLSAICALSFDASIPSFMTHHP